MAVKAREQWYWMLSIYLSLCLVMTAVRVEKLREHEKHRDYDWPTQDSDEPHRETTEETMRDR